MKNFKSGFSKTSFRRFEKLQKGGLQTLKFSLLTKKLRNFFDSLIANCSFDEDVLEIVPVVAGTRFSGFH